MGLDANGPGPLLTHVGCKPDDSGTETSQEAITGSRFLCPARHQARSDHVVSGHLRPGRTGAATQTADWDRGYWPANRCPGTRLRRAAIAGEGRHDACLPGYPLTPRRAAMPAPRLGRPWAGIACATRLLPERVAVRPKVTGPTVVLRRPGPMLAQVGCRPDDSGTEASQEAITYPPEDSTSATVTPSTSIWQRTEPLSLGFCRQEQALPAPRAKQCVVDKLVEETTLGRLAPRPTGDAALTCRRTGAMGASASTGRCVCAGGPSE